LQTRCKWSINLDAFAEALKRLTGTLGSATGERPLCPLNSPASFRLKSIKLPKQTLNLERLQLGQGELILYAL
jgi:hypothetical protein